jgi:hypothetical protein
MLAHGTPIGITRNPAAMRATAPLRVAPHGVRLALVTRLADKPGAAAPLLHELGVGYVISAPFRALFAPFYPVFLQFCAACGGAKPHQRGVSRGVRVRGV